MCLLPRLDLTLQTYVYKTKWENVIYIHFCVNKCAYLRIYPTYQMSKSSAMSVNVRMYLNEGEKVKSISDTETTMAQIRIPINILNNTDLTDYRLSVHGNFHKAFKLKVSINKYFLQNTVQQF